MTSTDFSAARSGIYRSPADVDSVREGAKAARLVWIEGDLAHVRSKPELLAGLAAAGGFPAGFGHNWDALADSLGDFSWRPAGGYVLYLRSSAAAQRALGAEWQTFLEVLRKAAGEWKARGKAFITFVDDVKMPVWP